MNRFFDHPLQLNEDAAYDNLENLREFIYRCEINEFALPDNFPECVPETGQVMLHYQFLLRWYYTRVNNGDQYGAVNYYVIRRTDRFLMDITLDMPPPMYGELLFLRYGSSFDQAGVATGSDRLQRHCKLLQQQLDCGEIAHNHAAYEANLMEEWGDATFAAIEDRHSVESTRIEDFESRRVSFAPTATFISASDDESTESQVVESSADTSWW